MNSPEYYGYFSCSTCDFRKCMCQYYWLNRWYGVSIWIYIKAQTKNLWILWVSIFQNNFRRIKTFCVRSLLFSEHLIKHSKNTLSRDTSNSIVWVRSLLFIGNVASFQNFNYPYILIWKLFIERTYATLQPYIWKTTILI